VNIITPALVTAYTESGTPIFHHYRDYSLGHPKRAKKVGFDKIIPLILSHFMKGHWIVYYASVIDQDVYLVK
jgi:hypothetical protein